MPFYDPDGFQPDISVGYLAKRIHQASLAGLAPALEREGLTHLQWSALVSLWFGRGSNAAALARDLGHDGGATTRLIDTLEQGGWVERVRDTADRRVVTLRLTQAGENAALRGRVRVVDCWNGWLDGWDPRDVERLIGDLQRLRLGLERATAEAPCV